MQAVLVDDRLNPGEFGDLMDQGIGVCAVERLPTGTASAGLAVLGRPEPVGSNQGPESLAMAGLSAPPSRARRCGRLALQSYGIGRRRLGGVGGVELEPGLEISDTSLQFGDPSLVCVPDREDGGLSLKRDGAPERFRDGRRKGHDTVSTQLVHKRFGHPVNGYEDR
jgi:hypothetical protein